MGRRVCAGARRLRAAPSNPARGRHCCGGRLCCWSTRGHPLGCRSTGKDVAVVGHKVPAGAHDGQGGQGRTAGHPQRCDSEFGQLACFDGRLRHCRTCAMDREGSADRGGREALASRWRSWLRRYTRNTEKTPDRCCAGNGEVVEPSGWAMKLRFIESS